jgi:hypothetical protein
VSQPLATDADAEPVRPTVVSISGGRPRTWLAIVAGVWALILIGGIGWAELHGGPTDREQTTVAAAQPYADTAAVRLATAVESDGQAVALVSGFDKAADCRVSLARSGQRYQRVVTALVTPGTESALLDRVAARLPAEYKTTVNQKPAPTLVADAGYFVRVTGTRAGDGLVRFVVDTGSCRAVGDLSVPAEPTGDRAAVTPVFGRLGLPAVQWHAFTVPCAGTSGQLSTVEGFGPDNQVSSAANLPSTLEGLGTPVVSTAGLDAYRSGPAAVGVRVENNHVVVTATEGCGQ